MFKVFINDGLHEIPNDDIFYIVGKEGLFIKKSLGIVDSITPIENISVLNSVETCVKMNIKKISKLNFAKMYMFLKDVYKKFQSEAILLIFYNEKTYEYKLFAPKQEVSGASMDYDRNMTIKNYTMIGDIHSHGTMSAFHSSVDDNDEESFDGLHITLGHIMNSNFSISSSIVINGHRFLIDPLDYIEGIQKVNYVKSEDPIYNNTMLTTLHRFKEDSDIDIVNKCFESEKYETDKKYNFLSGVLKETKRNTKWIKQVTQKVYKRNNYFDNQSIINNNWYDFVNNYKIYTNNYEPIENINDIDDIDKNPCLNCKYNKDNKDNKDTNILKNELQIQTEEDQCNTYMPLNFKTCLICGNQYLQEDYKNGCPFCYQK